MCNLILNNKTTDDILVNINDKSLILTENEVITFDSMDVKFHITAQVNPENLIYFQNYLNFLFYLYFHLSFFFWKKVCLKLKLKSISNFLFR